MEKIVKLQQLMKLLQNDTITPQEVEKFLAMVVDAVKKAKENFEKISEETLTDVADTLKYIESEHEKMISKTEKITDSAVSTLETRLQEVKDLVDNLKMQEPKHGVDGKDADEEYIISEVLNRIELPEQKEYEYVSGEDIVEKINQLSTDEKYQIDASHIKNLPQATGGRLGSTARNLWQLNDVTLTSPANDDVLKYDSATGQWINGTGGGGGTPGGSDTQLQYNNAGSFGGISGATTNGTTVTYTTGNLVAHDVKASQSAGIDILSSSGTVTALFGAGGGANSTFYGGSKFDYATASTVPYFDSSKNLISSAVTPTELGYLSGVTSAIQTQLNAKQATLVSGTNIKTINGATLLGSGDIVIDATVTLADLSANSTTSPTSLYTMTSTIPVEFRSSDGNPILFIEETGEMVGINTATPATRLHVYGSKTSNFLRTESTSTGSSNLMSGYLTQANANQLAGWWDFYTATGTSPDFFGKLGFKFEGGTSGAARQFQLFVGDNATPRIVVNSTGMGFGITPAQKIDTNGGSIDLSGSSGSGADTKIWGGTNSPVTYINMYNSATGGIDVYNLTSTSQSTWSGSLAVTGTLSTSLDFTLVGGKGILSSGSTSFVPYDGGTGNTIFKAAQNNANFSKFRFLTGTTPTQAFLIDQFQNVGIGTNFTSGTDPVARLDVTGLSLTGSLATGAVNITQTWNTTGTPTALKMNITDTASNAASLLMDLQVGGVSQFSISKMGGVLACYVVEANTAGSGSPNILTAAESRKVLTNEGATALNYHTLPSAVVGLTYTFYVDDADGIRVTANTGDIIQINGVASSTAGYAECTAIGGSLTLVAINATDWVATSVIGTWSLA